MSFSSTHFREQISHWILSWKEVFEEEVTAELEDVLGVEVKPEAPDMVFFWSEDSHSSLSSGW